LSPISRVRTLRIGEKTRVACSREEPASRILLVRADGSSTFVIGSWASHPPPTPTIDGMPVVLRDPERFGRPVLEIGRDRRDHPSGSEGTSK
jgi:hypothetical protein